MPPWSFEFPESIDIDSLDCCRASECGGDGVVRSIAIDDRSGLRAVAVMCAGRTASGRAGGGASVQLSALEAGISFSLVGVIEAGWPLCIAEEAVVDNSSSSIIVEDIASEVGFVVSGEQSVLVAFL